MVHGALSLADSVVNASARNNEPVVGSNSGSDNRPEHGVSAAMLSRNSGGYE